MKYLKRALLGIVVLLSIYGVGRFVDVAYGSFSFVKRMPYLVMQTQNSMTIKWQTPQSEIGIISYGTQAYHFPFTIADKQSTKKHSLKLQNLQACTRYFYKVVSQSLLIEDAGRNFTTLCEKKELERIWVIGDSGQKGKKQKAVYHSMLQYINLDYKNLDMWLLLGDNAYSSGTQKQYNKKLFKPYKELVKKFVPWAVIGNHDARRWAFYNIWDFPTKGESGGVASGYEEFYSIDGANYHLVMLDSETTNLAKDSKMAKWLKKDLAKNKKPWTIVAFHTPPYSDGGHKSDEYFNSGGNMRKMRENFVPIFDKYGVDVVLSGHSHAYERSKLIIHHIGKSDTFTEKNILQNRRSNYTKSLINKQNSGTIYIVSGSSSKLDHAKLKHPALPYSYEKYGSLILEITPNTFTSKFLTIDGTIADKFIITKEVL